MVLNEKVRFIDLQFFNKFFNSFIDYSDKVSIKLNTIDFNNFEKSDFIYDLDGFFITCRSDFSNLFKFSAFHCGDFSILSEEYFNFYPIIKTHILNAFVNAPEQYFFSENIFNEVLKVRAEIWDKNRISVKPISITLKSNIFTDEFFTKITDMEDIVNAVDFELTYL